MDLKSELTDVQAEKVVVEKEVHEQLLQLHTLQLQLHAKAGQTVDSSSIKDRMVCTFIQLVLHSLNQALALYIILASRLIGFGSRLWFRSNTAWLCMKLPADFIAGVISSPGFRNVFSRNKS